MTSHAAVGFTGDRKGPDLLLWLSVAALVVLGCVMVFSASAFRASDRAGDFTFFLQRHAIRVAIAMCGFGIAFFFDYHLLTKLGRVLICVSIMLLIAVLVIAWNDPVRGSVRWIRLGPLSIQPSEIAKLAIVIYLADFMSRKRRHLDSFKKGLLPALLVLGSVVALVALERNLSCVVHIALISSPLLFIGGARIRHLLGVGVLFGAVVAASLFASPYQRDRIMTYKDGSFDALGKDYQVQQSLIAMGSGGLTGVGLGQSKQKYYFLPDSHTDFVFSVIGEEGGFVFGSLFVMGLFLVFGWRGTRIAMRAPDEEGRLLAMGITLLVFLYAMLNIAVVTRSIPTTGVPLPFISYGGSSLLVALFGSGVLLNISRQSTGRRFANADQVKRRLSKRGR